MIMTKTVECSTCECSREFAGKIGLPQDWLCIAQHLEDGTRYFLGKWCSIYCVIAGDWETLLDRREPLAAIWTETPRPFWCRQCRTPHTGTKKKPGWLSLGTHDADGRRTFYGTFCGRACLIHWAELSLRTMMEAA